MWCLRSRWWKAPLIAACALVLWVGGAGGAGATISGKVATPLPAVQGPLPATASSYPWGAAAHGLTPIDLAAHHYVEQEYLVRGEANVYSEASGGNLGVNASGPYETRIIVRRPASPAAFSGTVVLELINPTSNYDVDIMWAADHDYFMSRGDIYVGISIKPVVLATMRTFDPARYSGLSMANPDPGNTCPQGSSSDETGLAWDMISQVGALLRSTSTSSPLYHFRVQHLYLTGYSQSGGYMVTYINDLAPHFTLAGGSPIFDGYLVGAGYGFTELAPINQCAPPAAPGTPAYPEPPGVPQFVLHPPGSAKVIDVQTLSDAYAFFGWAGEQPDGDTPGDYYRLYQVAGSSHIWTYQVDFTPGPDELVRGGFPANDWHDNCLYPDNPFPLQYQLDAAFDNLDRWVRTGTPAPHAPHIDAVGDGTPAATILTDQDGNALGGVRSPAVDVPTATYYGTTPGGGTCLLLWGHYTPLTSDRLHQLYPTHAAYVSKVQTDAAALLKGRWLTKEDATAIVSEAKSSAIP
jgi:hypothetical protein